MHPIEIVEVQFCDGGEDHDSGCVNDDVDAPELLLDRIEQYGDFTFVGDVRMHRDGATARCDDGVNCFLGALEVS